MKRLLLFLLLFISLCAHAQVDIELKGTAPNNVPKLEVYITPSNFISGDFINGITFTVKWPTSCSGVSLGTLTSDLPLALTMSRNLTTFSDASFNYVVFNGADASSGGYNYASVNSTELKIMTIPITGTLGTCPFSIEMTPPNPPVTPTGLGDWAVDGVFGGAPSTNIQDAILGVPIVIPTAAIAGVTTICNGSSTTLTASGGPGTYTYAWSTPPGGAANPITVTPLTNTTYTVTVTDVPSGAWASTSVLVTVNPLPSFVFCPSNAAPVNSNPGTCNKSFTLTHPSVTPLVNCTTTLTIAFSNGSPIPASLPTGGTVTNASDPYTFAKGVTVVTYKITDGNGNMVTCSFTVTVNDVTAPVITCPSNIVQSNDAGLCSAVVTFTAPVGTDNCSGAVTALTGGLVSGSAFPKGVTTNSYTVTDASGNTATCSFTVTVNDVTAPVITCPSNIVQSNDAGLCSAVVNYSTPVGTDNCSGATTVMTFGLPTGSTFSKGITTSLYTVTDASGNTATCSFTVTINDTEVPTAICQNITVTLDNTGSATVTPSQINNGSSDNCGPVTLSFGPNSYFCINQALVQSELSVGGSICFTCADIGAHVIPLVVTDASGLTSTCNATITVGPSVTASVGPDITQLGLVFTMAANTPSVGETGVWSVVSPMSFSVSNINNVNSPTTTVTNLPANTPVTLRWTVTNASTCSTFDDVVLTRKATALGVKVYLHGPLNGTLMNDNLRTLAAFPTTSPYGGGETTTPSVLALSGPDAIVDWVQVQVRSSIGTVTSSKTGLLQRDGDIVAVDGVSPLEFSVSNGNYYINVNHRNHIGVMTATSIPLVNGVTTPIDFRSSSTPTLGINAQYTVSSTVRAMYAGDASGNKQVKYSGAGTDNFTILTTILEYVLKLRDKDLRF